MEMMSIVDRIEAGVWKRLSSLLPTPFKARGKKRVEPFFPAPPVITSLREFNEQLFYDQYRKRSPINRAFPGMTYRPDRAFAAAHRTFRG